MNQMFKGFLFTKGKATEDELCLKVKEHFKNEWEIVSISDLFGIYGIRPRDEFQPEENEAWELAHELSGDEAEYFEPEFEPIQEEQPKGGFIECEAHLPGTENPYWSLQQMQIKEAWDYSYSLKRPVQGQGVRIGHTDTGYTRHDSIYHQQLRVADGWNFYYANHQDAYDRQEWGVITNHGHGTSTASCIIGNGRHKVQGAAPRAQLIPIRLSNSVMTTIETYIKGLEHAVKKGCHITTTSMGAAHMGHSAILDRALQKAIYSGVIPVAAAGQFGGWDFDLYPASSPYCISATASTIAKRPWRKALKSRRIDIAAPGESVFVATVKDQNEQNLTHRSCGTSFSTAYTTSVAALWYAHWGVQNLHQRFGRDKIYYVFKNLLYNYAHGAGWNKQSYGPGIINALTMLKAPISFKASELDQLKRDDEAEQRKITLAEFTERIGVKSEDGVHCLEQILSDEITHSELSRKLGMYPDSASELLDVIEGRTSQQKHTHNIFSKSFIKKTKRHVSSSN